MLFVDGGSDFVSIGGLGEQANGGALNINAVSASAVFGMITRSATDGHTNIINMQKTPATSGNYTATASGDVLGEIRFSGVNTSAAGDIGAHIQAVQSGTASGSVPTDLYIDTNEITRLGIKLAETAFNDGGADVDFRVESDGNDHMLFVDGGANVVNIGHATNGVGASSGTLLVNFTGNTANGIKVRDTRGESGTNNAIVFVRGDANAGAITTTTAPATQYTTASDKRLKENIADADDASSKIDAIKVRKYDWKNDGSHQDYGLIAQELQPIAPDAVVGDANSEKMMSVDYAKLVPMMLKEIQSLRARVADLES
tara:strand:- start:286 stop:1230 length:945 start_codon:yes stop_codon:yes gene_type:complete